MTDVERVVIRCPHPDCELEMTIDRPPLGIFIMPDHNNKKGDLCKNSSGIAYPKIF